MGNDTFASRLRYLDADDVDDDAVAYDGLAVVGPDGDKLGKVDGFIIDPEGRRVHHIVVDSGGWFTSQRFLLPIGHAALTEDRTALRTDISREALRRFPDYEEARFREFTDDELRAFERNTVVACCPDEPLEEVSSTAWGYSSWRHYQQPAWWGAGYEQERLRPVGQERAGREDMWRETSRRAPLTAAATEPIVTGAHRDRELVTAREERAAGEARHEEARREPHTAADEPRRSGRDASPHLDGRAQPGDVLGIETGGEVSRLGDTAEDEDKRRGDAEKSRR